MIEQGSNGDKYINCKFFKCCVGHNKDFKSIDMTFGKNISIKKSVYLARIIKEISLGKNSDPLYCSEHGDHTDIAIAVSIRLFSVRIKIWIYPHT